MNLRKSKTSVTNHKQKFKTKKIRKNYLILTQRNNKILGLILLKKCFIKDNLSLNNKNRFTKLASYQNICKFYWTRKCNNLTRLQHLIRQKTKRPKHKNVICKTKYKKLKQINVNQKPRRKDYQKTLKKQRLQSLRRYPRKEKRQNKDKKTYKW